MLQAARRPILYSRPGWAFPTISPAPAIVLDFARGWGWQKSVSPVESFLTTIRASDGYADFQSGYWQAFTSNQPRITDKGLLVEESRTNSIRNNSMQGAVAGTPGTLPTNWFSSVGTTGLSKSVVGVGTEDGIDCIYLRFFGTSAAASSITIGFEGGTAIAASSGDTRTASHFVRLAGGSLTGLSAFNIVIAENTSGGAFVTGATYSQSSPTSAGLATQRNVATRTLSGGGTVAAVQANYSMSVANGAAVDVTLCIGWPQNEQGAFVTSPIRTAGSAATRVADLISVVGGAQLFGPAGWMFAEAVVTKAATGVSQFIGRFSDGTSNNQVAILLSNDSTAGIVTAASAVFDGFAGAYPDTATSDGVKFKIAARYAANDLAMSLNGGTVLTDTSATIPSSISVLHLGSNHNRSVGFGSGQILRFAYGLGTPTNAALQALST